MKETLNAGSIQPINQLGLCKFLASSISTQESLLEREHLMQIRPQFTSIHVLSRCIMAADFGPHSGVPESPLLLPIFLLAPMLPHSHCKARCTMSPPHHKEPNPCSTQTGGYCQISKRRGANILRLQMERRGSSYIPTERRGSGGGSNLISPSEGAVFAPGHHRVLTSISAP